jgi:dolichyl-phosphate-mannose-protein mannosyltransferase
LDEYSTSSNANIAQADSTSTPVVAGDPAVAPAVNQEAQPPLGDANATPQPIPEAVNEQQIIGQEHKVEYRDQDGNILDEEQVKSLEGKVEFSTRYETHTRVLDINGKPVSEAGGSPPEGVAPPHPDVEGNNPETAGIKEDDSAAQKQKPATQSEIQDDVGKEKAVDGAAAQGGGEARPASEGNEATKKKKKA